MDELQDFTSWDRYEKSYAWLHENYGKLAKEFNNNWVGVSEDKVVASSDSSLPDLIDKLKSRSYNPSCIVVEFISTQKELLII